MSEKKNRNILQKSKTILVTGAVLGLAYVALVVGFQQNLYFETANAQSNTSVLTLEMTTPKNEYLQIEPIPVSLDLSNRTNQPISWKGILLLGPNVNFLTRDINGAELRYDGGKYASGLLGFAVRTMPPGEKTKQDVLIERALSEILFPAAGRYEFQVEFVYSTEGEGREKVKIISNSVSIVIKEPTGVERQAYDFIKGPLAEVNNKADVRAIAEREQEFVNKFKNTVYAKYISVSLARTYQTLGEDDKAFRELCKVSQEDFYYTKEVKKRVYEIDIKLRPVVMLPLPENAPTPVIPFPCSK